METREKSAARQMVPAAAHALAMRSAALVARGLRDLARDSNWLVHKVFTEHAPHIAISPGSRVTGISPQSNGAPERLKLYDMERSAPVTELAPPGRAPIGTPEMRVAFVCSSTGRYLVAACNRWQPELHAFDIEAKTFLGAFGAFADFPSRLAWSAGENYFVAASGGKSASLRLWNMGTSGMPLSSSPARELGAPDCIEKQTCEAESSEDGVFSGYGCTAFSPDERSLATVAEIQGHWADDFVVLMDVPGLEPRRVFQAQGRITSLTWTPDSRQILYCAAGQAFRLSSLTMDAQALPFGAELCACHPRLPLSVCFSSWLKNSARGRLFVADLNSMRVFDEHAAEGIVDLRWSADGSKAYAVTQDGMAHIYELPLA